MKKNTHPDYDFVVFKDSSTGFEFLSKSTIKSDETTKWEDGNEYPLIRIEISSKSHPFYTGKQRIVDTDNRVDKFEKKTKLQNKDALSKKKEKRRKRVTKTNEIKGSKGLTLKDMLKQMQ